MHVTNTSICIASVFAIADAVHVAESACNSANCTAQVVLHVDDAM